MFIRDNESEIIIDHYDNNPVTVRCMFNWSKREYQLVLTDNQGHIIIATDMTVNGSRVVAE